MESRFHARVKECESQEELTEYLLDCMPILREYTAEETATEQVRSKVLGVEVNVRKGKQRQDIYKRYMSEVEKSGDYEKKKETHDLPCKNCGKYYTFFYDEVASEDICKECGVTEYVLGDEVGFKEEQEMEKTIVYSYKRDNHFNEWVSQFQAKESTTVPQEVIDQLRSEFKKMKIKNLSEITHEKVKALLKKLDKNKYYEHAPYITTILNGIRPPRMSQPLEDRLRLMFYQIQKPFERHKPPDRKNFLSYSYVLYKFCELLGEDEFLPCFPLLKSKEKLYIQDTIWKKICDELQWEFIKTV
jgi:transposase-like protein